LRDLGCWFTVIELTAQKKKRAMLGAPKQRQAGLNFKDRIFKHNISLFYNTSIFKTNFLGLFN